MTTTVPVAQWRQLAACRDTDQPEAFFPGSGMDAVEAQRICAGCRVTAECLQYALDTRQEHGVWGAATAAERKRMRREADRGEVRTGAVLGWCVGLLVLLGFVLAYGGHLNNVIGGQ